MIITTMGISDAGVNLGLEDVEDLTPWLLKHI